MKTSSNYLKSNSFISWISKILFIVSLKLNGLQLSVEVSSSNWEIFCRVLKNRKNYEQKFLDSEFSAPGWPKYNISRFLTSLFYLYTKYLYNNATKKIYNQLRLEFTLIIILVVNIFSKKTFHDREKIVFLNLDLILNILHDCLILYIVS